MEQFAVGIVDDHRRHHLADVADLAAAAYYHRPRRYYLLAVGIFLCHTQRVLSRRNVDTDGTAEVRKGFDSFVETGIFALL